MAGVIDDETLQMYIEESREHLETIEADLLQIEQQGANIDEELVNKVFRAAHSIKGGGGFLALEKIKQLAHKIENVLDMMRNYQLTPNPENINIALEAFDFLGVMINDALNSNDYDIAAHITALSQVLSGNLKDEEKQSISTTVLISHPSGDPRFNVTEFDISQARRGGKILYILDYDLINDVQRQNKTPLDIIKMLEDAGTLLDIQLGLATVGDLDSISITPRIPMCALYSSIIEPDLIGSLMGLEDTFIHVLEEDAAASPPPLTAPPQQPSPQLTKPPAAPALKAPAEPTTAGKTPSAKSPPPLPDSLRVHVSVLDQLMNRAGELVLARNQLLQCISSWDRQAVIAAGQRIDMVTSELQEAIMLTRMQPVGNIFNKFPRVVRDLARDLKKEIELELEGKDVELDKTIIEGLADPLTHLVRNSCDHGIELPDARTAKGKTAQGTIRLRAFHESGQVIIEIIDDGKGLDPVKLVAKGLEKGLITPEQAQSMSEKEKFGLIMLPGFSTATAVTDVSGRGVGMDVVKTNLDKMGGQVELISKLDTGTTVRIKLPLTLAIIPSLLVSSANERFALPQVNVGELLRIPADEIRQKIEKVGGADVLILRGELIPLLQLGNVLGLQQIYYDQKAGAFRPDRRADLADRRLEEIEAAELARKQAAVLGEIIPERRSRRDSDVNVVILQAGAFKYGLVVQAVHDTVEIVVKPLGRHLAKSEVYAGATIMGDGRVALILDVSGLARHAELRTRENTELAAKIAGRETGAKDGATSQTLLFFRNGSEEYCAVPLHMVLRVEQIKADQIEFKGGKKVIQYRNGTLPVFALEEAANVEMLEERDELAVILFIVAGREVGLLAVPPLDVLEIAFILDEVTLMQPGISGSAIIRGKTTLMVDIFGLIQTLNPDWFEDRTLNRPPSSTGGETGNTESASGMKPILLVEDSHFFRAQVKHFMEDEGYTVWEAEDGAQAWQLLTGNSGEVGLVVTDLEMPNMDGFELTRLIKNDHRFSHLKVIALTSLAGEEDVSKGAEVGIDDYQIKLDKEKLLQGIYKFLQNNLG